MKTPAIEVKTRSLGYTKIREDQLLTFDHERVSKADFSKRKLLQLAAVGSRFEQCRFDKIRVESCSLGAGKETSEYIDCSFDGARMHMGAGGYARFVRCSFRDVDLRDWYCFAVELVDCTFSGRLRKAIFNGAVRDDMQHAARRTHNEFRGNDFSEIRLEDVAFRTGVALTQQKLPTGPEYLYLPNAEATIQRARVEVMGWRDLELRQPAMGMIKSLEEELLGDQHQLLLRLDDYPKSTRQADEALFALLRAS